MFVAPSLDGTNKLRVKEFEIANPTRANAKVFSLQVNSNSSHHGYQRFSLSGKTCCAFDCYTCGRLGGVRQKRRQTATLRNYMQRRCDLHNNLDIVLVLITLTQGTVKDNPK